MQALMETENVEDNRRRLYVERFNQGYRGYAAVHNNCTNASTIALQRYLNEGAEITRNLTARFNR